MNTGQLVIVLLVGFLVGSLAVLGGWLTYWVLGLHAGVVLAFLGLCLAAGSAMKTYGLVRAA